MEWRKSKRTYLITVLAIGMFLYFFFAVKGGNPLLFDSSISQFITHLFPKSTHSFFKLFNVVGSAKGIGVISLVIIAWLWAKKNYAGMAVYVFTLASGYMLNNWLKEYVGRPRPEAEHFVAVKTLSFPSGHAMMGIILYTLIAYFIIEGLKSKGQSWIVAIAAAIIVTLMGISRIVLQVHYPSDIVAGFAAGFVWSYIWIAGYEKFNHRLNN